MKHHRGVDCAGCGTEITNDYPTYCIACSEAPFCTLCTINDVEVCGSCKVETVETKPHKKKVACCMLIDKNPCEDETKGKCCNRLLCAYHLKRHLDNHSNVLGLMIPFLTIGNCIGSETCITKGGYRTRFGELCPLHISNQMCCGCNSYFPNSRYYRLNLNVARICCIDCGWKLKTAIWSIKTNRAVPKDLIGKIVGFFANAPFSRWKRSH